MAEPDGDALTRTAAFEHIRRLATVLDYLTADRPRRLHSRRGADPGNKLTARNLRAARDAALAGGADA